MDIGMPTLLEIKSLENCAALCRVLDLRFIELNMNLPKYFHLAKTQNYRVVLETKNISGLNESVEWVRENVYMTDSLKSQSI